MKQGSGQCANVTFHGTIPPSYEEQKMGAWGNVILNFTVESRGGIRPLGSLFMHADCWIAINCHWIADFNPLDIIDPLELQGLYIN